MKPRLLFIVTKWLPNDIPGRKKCPLLDLFGCHLVGNTFGNDNAKVQLVLRKLHSDLN